MENLKLDVFLLKDFQVRFMKVEGLDETKKENKNEEINVTEKDSKNEVDVTQKETKETS